MKTWQSLVIVGFGLVLYSGCKTHRDVATKPNGTLDQWSYTNAPPQNMSRLAKGVLHRLNLSGRVSIVASPLTSTNTTTSKLEHIIIRPPPGMSDGFTYTIRIDHNTRQYWWTKQGGIAGIYEMYGPVQYQEHESNEASQAIGAEAAPQPER